MENEQTNEKNEQKKMSTPSQGVDQLLGFDQLYGVDIKLLKAFFFFFFFVLKEVKISKKKTQPWWLGGRALV